MLAVQMTDTEIGIIAVINYVAYRTTQHIRHKHGRTAEYTRHYMNQMLHEAVRDSDRLRAVVGGLPPNSQRKRKRRVSSMTSLPPRR